MCLVLIALQQHPDWPVVIWSNRDEFLDRPTTSFHWWTDPPDLLAGRDDRLGGTWCGITRGGRVGLVTNFRDPAAYQAGRRSRGLLLRSWFTHAGGTASFVACAQAERTGYNDYNLLLADAGEWIVYSSRYNRSMPLQRGLYGVSNHCLDTPWPKVVRGKQLMAAWLAQAAPRLDAGLIGLGDVLSPADAELPQTGVPLERERLLAPICVCSPEYGTRSSTVLAQRRTGQWHLLTAERGAAGRLLEPQEFSWMSDTSPKN